MNTYIFSMISDSLTAKAAPYIVDLHSEDEIHMFVLVSHWGSVFLCIVNFSFI